MRSLLIAVLASATIVIPARACGFEDPNSVSMQRVMLNLVYPNSLHVQGAIDTALRRGLLRPDHFKRRGELFAFHRTVGALRQFADDLADGATSNLPKFSSVLIGPVLWTRFHPGSDGVIAETHADGPLAGSVVMITDGPVLAALLSGDVSGADADVAGLVRFYGDAADIASLREALALAFPTSSVRMSRPQGEEPVPAAR